MDSQVCRVLCCLAVLALAATTASAEPKDDMASGEWQGGNVFNGGYGSGWNDGEWIYYDETNWWNQWFYDDPPTDLRWKEIEYDVHITAYPGALWTGECTGEVIVAINWSTLDFPASGPDGAPPMPYEERYIERDVVAYFDLKALELEGDIYGALIIKTFNPEWVSVDVYVDAWYEVDLEGDLMWEPMIVDVMAYVSHECVPEPATMSLLAAGVAGLLLRRKRA